MKKFPSWTLNAAGRWLPRALELAQGVRRRLEEAADRAVGEDFERRFASLQDHYRERGEDPFGADIPGSRNVVLGVSLLYHHYFRVDTFGVDRVPPGKVMLVSNHSGQLPLDGAMISAALFWELDPPRLVRSMVARWVKQLPVAEYFWRSGQVEGTPERCRQLLDAGETVLVFPEGVSGISKPFHRRYQLEPFGKGFMRIAMETETPIVPVAVIGAEEQYLSLGHWTWLKERLGAPVVPVIPQLLVPGGVMPLPTKYRIHFGEPMYFSGSPDDIALVSDNVWTVREAVQALVAAGLAARGGVFS